MELTSALRFLQLKDVPKAWVDAVWDAEFTESISMDNIIEEQLSVSTEQDFRNLHKCLQALQDEQLSGKDSQVLWAVLGEHGVSVKCLVAVLSFFVLNGKTKGATVERRLSCLHAASIYMLILGIPGSIANKAFHEILLDTCVDMMCHCWPQESAKKRKKDNVKSSQTDGKRAKRPHKETRRMELDDDEEEEEEEEGQIHFSTQDLVKIRDCVVILLQSLLKLLQTFPLKDFRGSANNCAQVFTKLLYFEPVVGVLSFAEPQVLTKTSIPEMSFYGLKLLCSSKHGNQEQSLNKVFTKLLYVIVMMNKGTTGRPTMLPLNQATISTRDQAIHFVCHIVDEMKELGQPLLLILLQHICYQMVEKSEFRMHGAHALGMLSSQMNCNDYASFVDWLLKYSASSKMIFRLFSVDVVMTLLEQPERNVDDCQDPKLACFLTHKFLIQNLLFPRRQDSSATVRSHALACLAQCLELSSMNATQAVHNLFSATALGSECSEASSEHPQKTYRTLPFRTVDISSSDSVIPDASGNLAHLLRRVQDVNVNVRKSALQALTGLLRHNIIPVSSENLAVLAERTRDPAVSVKKKALQCVGELISVKPNWCEVQKAWLLAVLPAVMDSEDSVKEKALEAVEHVVVKQVKPFSMDRHMDPHQRLTWDLLALLSSECQNLRRYFSRAFSIWAKRNEFSQPFLKNLISHTAADHSAAAWLLISTIAPWTKKIPCSDILDAWDNMVSSKNTSAPSCCHIISVVGHLSSQLNDDSKERIVDDVMALLKTFTMSLEMISAALQTLYQLGRRESIKQTQAFLEHHCGELLVACESYLASIFLRESGANDLNEGLMVKYLHTLGVASLHCPARVNKRLVLLVECVLTTRSENLAACQDELPVSQPLSQFRVNSLSTKVRAHGVITLGKLCLQHQDLAQKYLPVFARELEVGTEGAVRNNVLIVMCDLCVRYTNVVDLYIPNISACLRDDEAIVREHAVTMLTNLLQEEFVKWKGSLFFHFIVALVDPVPAIASLCEFSLLHLLLKKNPEMFSQHFIECIFHFNSYSKHKCYNKFPQSEREKVRFSLKGPQNREKRFRIYRFLLEHMTDAQRFSITNKISQNVLASFVDNDLDLDTDGAEILSETFNVLSLKEMKLQVIRAPAGGAAGDEAEEENTAKAVLQAAQKKAITHVQKKAFIGNTVPLIISLKTLLEQQRSPVLRDLMSYLQVTMQDYRHEVKEFFEGDEQLAAELEFAIQQAEKEKDMEERMENCSVAEERPPAAQTPVQQQPFTFATPHPPPPEAPSAQVTQSKRPGHDRSRQEDLSTKSIHLEKTVMLKGAVMDRAISTPRGVNVDLTFDEGFSAIFSDQAVSGADQDPSVLHVQSRDQRSSGPRQWNVESPLRQKTRQRLH
ncbi:condensin-2 complex subunit D3 [Synchiropus splendidus]|uniref:condensin-2 complex subunit D3 n=1 Tax=Synchiropus splendidus TaxID=270530 RepID=UPI00237DBDF6|nr:condensin-2 complex subunit D3 [Synchiropus splendidus]